MIVKVTDRDLIDKTGGIVQGMSGSPIIQNGKLVGALTHVIVGNPQRGMPFLHKLWWRSRTINQTIFVTFQSVQNFAVNFYLLTIEIVYSKW